MAVRKRQRNLPMEADETWDAICSYIFYLQQTKFMKMKDIVLPYDLNTMLIEEQEFEEEDDKDDFYEDDDMDEVFESDDLFDEDIFDYEDEFDPEFDEFEDEEFDGYGGFFDRVRGRDRDHRGHGGRDKGKGFGKNFGKKDHKKPFRKDKKRW